VSGWKWRFRAVVQKCWLALSPEMRLRIVRGSQRKFTVSVVAIIRNSGGEILVLEHLLRPFSKWGLPGGFINPYEQPKNALRREILEEAGLEITDEKLIRVRTIHRHIEILYMAKGDGAVSPKSNEIVSAGWFSPEDLPADMSENQKQVVREFAS
jgi:ADP-ribose pyrophosphatase YjhB (NUDIX family)